MDVSRCGKAGRVGCDLDVDTNDRYNLQLDAFLPFWILCSEGLDAPQYLAVDFLSSPSPFA